MTTYPHLSPPIPTFSPTPTGTFTCNDTCKDKLTDKLVIWLSVRLSAREPPVGTLNHTPDVSVMGARVRQRLYGCRPQRAGNFGFAIGEMAMGTLPPLVGCRKLRKYARRQVIA